MERHPSSSQIRRVVDELDVHDQLADERSSHEIGRGAFLKTSSLMVVGFAFGYTPARASASGAELATFLQLSRLACGVRDLSPKLAERYSSALDGPGVFKLTPPQFAN